MALDSATCWLLRALAENIEMEMVIVSLFKITGTITINVI